jgi:GNAT superfamily N-acetyltransferase
MDSRRGARPESEISIVAPNEDDLIDAAIALGDEHKKFLGLMPREGYRVAAQKGTLMVVRNDHGVMAYALYRISGQYVKITHLCVSGKARGQGLARRLINAISERHGDRIAITLKCRSDFPANAMWPHLGFKLQGETTGRSKERKKLSIWRLDHGYPDLFSSGGQPGPLKVMIDLNVFADIESSYERDEFAESGALVGDWLADQIELVISTRLRREIENHPDIAERNRQITAANKYPTLRKGKREIERIVGWITELVAQHGGLDLSRDENDISDVNYLAEAYLAGISVIATRDGNFIKWAMLVSEQTEVRVMRPAEVAVYVDELAHDQRYRPAQLQSTEYTLRRVRSGDAGLESFLNRSLGEKKSTYLGLVHRLLADGRHWNCQILRDPESRVIAFYVAGRVGNHLVVPLLRVQADRHDETVVRQLVFYIRNSARRDGLSMIRITDPVPTPLLKQAMQDDGFIERQGHWAAFVLSVCGPASLVEEKLAAAASGVSLDHEGLLPRMPASIAADRERRYWPAKITDSDLPNFLVPIKPVWSSELFGFPEILMPRGNVLGMSREHVYYRSPQPRREVAPGRILWYVSGSRGRDGVMAVIGCSRLEEVVVGKSTELHRRFQHLGVWKREQIIESGKDGTALALRFADTEIFDTFVPLSVLKELAEEYNQNLVLIAPQKITADLFAAIYREGQSGHAGT